MNINLDYLINKLKSEKKQQKKTKKQQVYTENIIQNFLLSALIITRENLKKNRINLNKKKK